MRIKKGHIMFYNIDRKYNFARFPFFIEFPINFIKKIIKAHFILQKKCYLYFTEITQNTYALRNSLLKSSSISINIVITFFD